MSPTLDRRGFLQASAALGAAAALPAPASESQAPAVQRSGPQPVVVASANGNRFSISYIDQFANRTVGIALGYARLKTPVAEEQVGLYEPWEVKDSSVTPGLPAGTFALAPDGSFSYTAPSGFVGWDRFTYTVSGALTLTPSETI